MKSLTLLQVELIPWYAAGTYWAISALRVKQTKVTEHSSGRLLHVAMMGLAFYLMFSRSVDIGVLRSRFLPLIPSLQVAGVVLTFLGAGLAIWARACIGQYWSGRVTLKVDHRLIDFGPYAYVRHPIYTGLLLGLLGTALVIGEWRCVAGLLLAIVELSRKAKKEEALLNVELGGQYQEYRARTGFLVPGIG